MWRLGALEPEELERLFRAADVFAFPSVKEGFGLAALEAIAAGLPLVASDLDVFRGFLTDGESALLTPVGDADALAAALARVATRPGAARAAAGGRPRGRRRHTWDASAPAHERVYERIGERGADAMEVTATFHGGFAATVEARGHTARRRRAGESGGNDDGFMPTELLFGALASCFALALGHAARKRDVDCPDLRVDVAAERAGHELRYDRVVVSASADVRRTSCSPTRRQGQALLLGVQHVRRPT